MTDAPVEPSDEFESLEQPEDLGQDITEEEAQVRKDRRAEAQAEEVKKAEEKAAARSSETEIDISPVE